MACSHIWKESICHHYVILFSILSSPSGFIHVLVFFICFELNGVAPICVWWFYSCVCALLVVNHSWLCYLIYFVLLLALCASLNSSQLNPRFKNFFYTFTSKFFVHLDSNNFLKFKLIYFKLLCTWNLWCVRWVHIFENKSTSIVVLALCCSICIIVSRSPKLIKHIMMCCPFF